MLVNPFIVSGYIAEPYFCDRTAETELLCKCINNQENVVLTSQRRMGKTKLVEHSIEQPSVKGQYIFVSIDILHTSSLRELILVLGHAIYAKIARRSERLTKLFANTMRSLSASFGYDPVQNTPTFDIIYLCGQPASYYGGDVFLRQTSVFHERHGIAARSYHV